MPTSTPRSRSRDRASDTHVSPWRPVRPGLDGTDTKTTARRMAACRNTRWEWYFRRYGQHPGDRQHSPSDRETWQARMRPILPTVAMTSHAGQSSGLRRGKTGKPVKMTKAYLLSGTRG